MKKNITIKDIARAVGVSVGTVDRVIHNRGRVSEKVQQKINDTLKELNYKPNPFARTLKKNAVYNIHVLIPNPVQDPYWIPCEHGIREVMAEYEAFDIEITLHLYDSFNPKSFSKLSNDLILLEPDAFLFVPLFEKESQALFIKLRKKGILIGTFNSPLTEHTGHYVGQDLFLSGRVAAKLFYDLVPQTSTIGIIHINEEINNAIHMQQKEKGFLSFFKDVENGHKVLTKTVNTTDMEETLRSLIKRHNVGSFFVVTSKTYVLALALERMNLKAVVIGYDLLPENIECLRQNQIQFLIHQGPKLQASLSLKCIVGKLLFNKEFPRQQLLPIEIVNAENVNSYL